MSPAIFDAVNEFFKRYNKTFAWTSASFVKVPQQHMNDCGPVVNELMRRLMMNESVVDKELNKAIGVRLRITQTRDILAHLTSQGVLITPPPPAKSN